MKRLFYISSVAVAVAFTGLALLEIIRAADARTLYLVTSTPETAYETMANAPNVFLSRADAEAAAKREYSHVYEITIGEK